MCAKISQALANAKLRIKDFYVDWSVTKLECLKLKILRYLQIALHLSVDHYLIPSEVSRLSRSQGAL
jgi:hypothetical protein